MNERVDAVLVGAEHRVAFETEMSGRRANPRVRVVMIGSESLPVGLNAVVLSTVPHPGAELVDAAHAAAASLTGMRADPTETRAPGWPTSL